MLLFWPSGTSLGFISWWQILKDMFTQKIRFSHYVLSLVSMEKSSEVLSDTKRFWSFTAKQRYSIFLNNWSGWRLVLKLTFLYILKTSPHLQLQLFRRILQLCFMCFWSSTHVFVDFETSPMAVRRYWQNFYLAGNLSFKHLQSKFGGSCWEKNKTKKWIYTTLRKA